MAENQIDREAFNRWRKTDPVTAEVFSIIKEERDIIANEVALGKYLGDPTANALKVGLIHGLDRLLNIEYDEAQPYDH